MFESFYKGILRTQFFKKVVGNDISRHGFERLLWLFNSGKMVAATGSFALSLNFSIKINSNKDSKRNTGKPSDKRRDEAPFDSGSTNKVGTSH